MRNGRGGVGVGWPVVVLVVVTLAMLVAAPSALRYGFIGLALVAGAIVFVKSRTLYIELCVWLWFLTPWLRRMIDWRTSYQEQSLMLVTPFLISAIAGVVLLRGARTLARPGGVPFAAAFAGIFFGTVYGLTRYAPFDVGRGLVNWVAPVLFGFFLYEERARYEEYRDAFVRSLLWGTLLTSLYGIYQFFFLPSWDETWMRGLVYSVFGDPFPRKVRVFSTMNAPAIFAFYLTAGLLVILAMLIENRRWRARDGGPSISLGMTRLKKAEKRQKVMLAVTAPIGLVALALTTTRALWVALVMGAGYLVATLPGRLRVRVAGISVIAMVLAIGGMSLPGIREIVVDKVLSFTSGTSDVSASARISGHEDALATLATEPLGEGMGSTDAGHDTNGSDDSLGPHDSTLLEFFYALGGPGTLVYGVGLAFGLGMIYFPRRSRNAYELEPFGFAIRAAIFAYFAECLLQSIAIGAPGFLLWAILAFSLAAADSADVSRPAFQRGNPAKLETKLVQEGS